MISEQQIKIPISNVNQRPFEEKPVKKVVEERTKENRDRKKSGGEEKRKSAADDIIAKRVCAIVLGNL